MWIPREESRSGLLCSIVEKSIEHMTTGPKEEWEGELKSYIGALQDTECRPEI
jgi:hypothetical protein